MVIMEVGTFFLLICTFAVFPTVRLQEPPTPNITTPNITAPNITAPNITAPNIKDLVFNNFDFAINLYRKISSHHDNNIFFSPLCVSTAFATLSLAAKGSTLSQILTGLNLAALERKGQSELIPQLFHNLQGNITQHEAMKLHQGTALFVQLNYEVEKAFSDQIKKFFNADVFNVDFGKPAVSMANINEYVKQRTGDKVKQMVTSIEPLTQLMLLNTIFFQGDWEFPFDPNNTRNDRFYINKYNILQVPMMFKEDKFYITDDDEMNVRVLRLPYLGGAAMLIALPDENVDYTVIDDEISADRFQKWINNLKKRKLEVHIPKFKMEQSYPLHKILPDLGIENIFEDSANLTGLSKEPGLKVSQVLHKAVIEVDEIGTRAAAATSVGITAYSLPQIFCVDRPFFFFIYHEATNSLLFMGRVIDPTDK
ncbi:protein Z-dependent protease inhibitor [Chanos chanos]|uniref:Protein Z-dependent protease inhibitor n=1 Tax=Chanos chanos TaxID=29144 RepID=A0A6J2V6R1_CHACN|nr:protein Z-dependent protease inhibitor-like [Chanos chanos]